MHAHIPPGPFIPSASSLAPLSVASSSMPASGPSFVPPVASSSVPGLSFAPSLFSSALPLPPSSSSVPALSIPPSSSRLPSSHPLSSHPPSSSVPLQAVVLPPLSPPLPHQMPPLHRDVGCSVSSGSAGKQKSSNGGAADCASKRSNTGWDSNTSQNLILLNSIQGSLGTIVDSLRQVGFSPESNIDFAIRMTQSEDSGISVDDQSMLASLFSDFPNKAASFRALLPGAARDNWIRRELEKYQSQ